MKDYIKHDRHLIASTHVRSHVLTISAWCIQFFEEQEPYVFLNVCEDLVLASHSFRRFHSKISSLKEGLLCIVCVRVCGVRMSMKGGVGTREGQEGWMDGVKKWQVRLSQVRHHHVIVRSCKGQGAVRPE